MQLTNPLPVDVDIYTGRRIPGVVFVAYCLVIVLVYLSFCVLLHFGGFKGPIGI